MDFMQAISDAVVAISEEYRQVHWHADPPEFNPRISRAHQLANVANLRRGRAIIREAFKVYVHVHELVALRSNINSFLSVYPAATQLRGRLGRQIWEYLENYRGAVTYLAFSTLRAKDTASSDLPAELQAFLEECTLDMETYIKVQYGEQDFTTFQSLQTSLADVIERGRRQGIEVQCRRLMKFLMRRFSRQPLFWLMYNLNFPVEGRMIWDEVSMWAIQCLRKRGDGIEPPMWPIELRDFDTWNHVAAEVWNEAVIEVFTDIRRRFCAFMKLHLTV